MRTSNITEAELEDGLHPQALIGSGPALVYEEIQVSAVCFFEQAHACTSINRLLSAFHDFVKTLGFSGAFCLKVPEVGDEPEFCLIFSTLPDDWQKRYLELGLLAHDPTLAELKQSYEPFSWTELRSRRKLTDQHLQMFQEAAAFGLFDGYSVPVFEAGGYSGVINLAGPQCLVSPEIAALVSTACLLMHSRHSQLQRKLRDAAFDLTERELECLRWAAAGKSDWEIGQILTISAKTVNYHIENTKRKFSVATRVQAIVAALRAGKLTA